MMNAINNLEDAMNIIERKRKKYKIGCLIREEKEWNKRYKKDQIFIEKEIIRRLLEECLNIPFSNEKIPVFLKLDDTEFSNTIFLNKEQILKVMKMAGFDVEIKRYFTEDMNYLLVEIDYKKIISERYLPKMIDIYAPIEDCLIADTTEQDWLISEIGSYIAYLLTDEGRTDTENQLTIMYYNDLLNMLINDTSTKGKTCKANIPVTIDEKPFNSAFGSINNVLSHLRDLLSIKGFEMEVITNEHDSHFKISIKEKDLLLDEKTDIVKKYK